MFSNWSAGESPTTEVSSTVNSFSLFCLSLIIFHLGAAHFLLRPDMILNKNLVKLSCFLKVTLPTWQMAWGPCCPWWSDHPRRTREMQSAQQSLGTLGRCWTAGIGQMKKYFTSSSVIVSHLSGLKVGVDVDEIVPIFSARFNWLHSDSWRVR